MQLMVPRSRLFGMLAGLAILAMSPPVRSQELEGENVNFDTADEVVLRGSFYQASKPKPPVAVLLHKYGGSREQAGWDKSLIKELNAKGFAVLAFDFRGHGESTTVNPGFWKVTANRSLIRGTKDRSKINYKEFMRDYLPMLVNDVAAAKRELDKRNDAGLVNSSNVILIGAEEGAAIGCLWLASEWNRKPLIRTIGVRWIVDPQGRPPGEDIAAAIWLSPTSALPGNTKSVGSFLSHKEIRDRVPMLFYAGKDDAAGSAAAKKLYDEVKKGGKGADFTFLRIEDKAGKARGAELVSKPTLKVPEEFTKYVESVIKKSGVHAWRMRDPDNGPPYILVRLQPFGYALP